MPTDRRLRVSARRYNRRLPRRAAQRRGPHCGAAASPARHQAQRARRRRHPARRSGWARPGGRSVLGGRRWNARPFPAAQPRCRRQRAATVRQRAHARAAAARTRAGDAGASGGASGASNAAALPPRSAGSQKHVRTRTHLGALVLAASAGATCVAATARAMRTPRRAAKSPSGKAAPLPPAACAHSRPACARSPDALPRHGGNALGARAWCGPAPPIGPRQTGP